MSEMRGAAGWRKLIPLTRTDGTPIDVDRDSIREVEPLGDGAIVFFKAGPPIRVMQSAGWVVALWKR